MRWRTVSDPTGPGARSPRRATSRTDGQSKRSSAGTGTGAAIAANKVAGVRAALCADAVTAAGARRRWNDANVLALSLRAVGEGGLGEILDAWFASERSAQESDRANIDRVAQLAAVDDRPR